MERLLRLPDVLAVTTLSRSELFRQVASGAFPRPVAVSPRKRAWPVEEIDAWIQARVAERDKAAAA